MFVIRKEYQQLVFCAGLALAACSNHATSVEIAAPPASVHVADEGPSKEEAEDSAGCMWAGESLWASDNELPLCFAKDKACYASAWSPFLGKVKLWVPPGDPAVTGGRVDLAAEGIRLRAWTDAARVVLAPKEPMVVGQVAIPRSGEVLRIERIAGAALDLALREVSGVTLRAGPLRAHANCAALSLSNKEYSSDAIRALAGGKAAIGERLLPAGGAVALSSSAGGAAVLELRTTDADTRVDVLELAGGRAKIVWWRPDVVLFGWVDESALGPAPSGEESLSAYGTLGGRGFGSSSRGIRCKRELSLFAMVHDARDRVGVIEKGTVFDRSISTPDGAFVRVDLRSPSFKLAADSSWLVATGALRDCQ